jgi:NAD(P)-dependent dehydrogenase (short-subunit alcohol dehydrogenase family)
MSAEGGLLAGRAAVVTGGTRGLGAAVARTFAAEGARVAVLDLAEALAAKGTCQGDLALPCDVSDEDQILAAITEAAQRLGRIDVVAANAGLVPPWRAAEDIDMAEWNHVFAVNVRGVALTIKHAAPRMRAGGSIIAMGSIMSASGAAGQMLYTATKHAVLGIVRCAAHDFGPKGIRVNALGPGPIATQALKDRVAARAAAGGLPIEEAMAAMAKTPLQRMATAEDVARAALFLASDLSSGVTGKLVPVDTGLLP